LNLQKKVYVSFLSAAVFNFQTLCHLVEPAVQV